MEALVKNFKQDKQYVKSRAANGCFEWRCNTKKLEKNNRWKPTCEYLKKNMRKISRLLHFWGKIS